jgi:flagellar protein FlaJ
MTLTQAVKATKTNDYGSLTKDVRKIASQIDWGIPFEDILENFSKKYSKMIQRTVSTIIEAYEGGGNISDILESSARSVSEINKIKKERVTNVFSQTITGYIIFFVFLGILVTLQRFLIPSLGFAESSIINMEEFLTVYRTIFQWLILIQGAFSGLVIGKLSEGNLISGLKHSILLTMIGYSTFILLM